MALRIIILSCFIAYTIADISYIKQSRSHVLTDVLKANRVIGGKNCAKGEFPHQVSLQFGYPPQVPFTHMCGGSIINERWILTAGHCIYNLPTGGQSIIKAGKNSISCEEPTEQSAYIEKIFLHPEYQGGPTPCDIALIKLATPFKFNKYVAPINLPQFNSFPVGRAVLSGWGSTSKTIKAILPDILQKVTLPLIDLQTCREAFRLLGEAWEVRDTHVCSGPLTGGFSACQGDSGGPLIGQNEYGITEIIGVVSWGHIPCGAYGAPAVFVRVSAFIDWINYIIKYSDYI